VIGDLATLALAVVAASHNLYPAAEVDGSKSGLGNSDAVVPVRREQGPAMYIVPSGSTPGMAKEKATITVDRAKLAEARVALECPRPPPLSMLH
jgi:hypothetical protein